MKDVLNRQSRRGKELNLQLALTQHRFTQCGLSKLPRNHTHPGLLTKLRNKHFLETVHNWESLLQELWRYCIVQSGLEEDLKPQNHSTTRSQTFVTTQTDDKKNVCNIVFSPSWLAQRYISKNTQTGCFVLQKCCPFMLKSVGHQYHGWRMHNFNTLTMRRIWVNEDSK